MIYNHILVFQRPGEESEVSKYILADIKQFASACGINISFFHDQETDCTIDVNKILYVAIGGDGTMLRAMDVSVRTNIYYNAGTSVVGFNAGNLGFLTMDAGVHQPSIVLGQIFDGDDNVEMNERLALSTMIDGREHFALNEFTFTPKNIAVPLTYQININGKYVTEQMGSGCLVATSTGSTAMAMSAGGAIMVPTADAMQIVPIIPHNLSSRPVITSGSDKITLSSAMERVDKVIVSSDGRLIGSFEKDAKIEITKAEVPAYVWYTQGRDFFNILSTKLDW